MFPAHVTHAAHAAHVMPAHANFKHIMLTHVFFIHIMLAHVMFGSCLAHLFATHSLGSGFLFFGIGCSIPLRQCYPSPDQVGHVGVGIVLTIWDF